MHACQSFKLWRSFPSLASEGRDALLALPAPWFERLGGPPVLGLFWNELWLSLLFLLAIGAVLALFRADDRRPYGVLAFVALQEAWYGAVDVRLLDDWQRIQLALSAVLLLSRGRLWHVYGALAAWHLAAGATRFGGAAPLEWRGYLVFLLAPPAWFAPWRPVRLAGLAAVGLAHLHFSGLGSPDGMYLMLPLLAAFWGFEGGVPGRAGLSRRDAAPALATALALLAALWHFAIPGDVRVTGEGRWTALTPADRVRRRTAAIDIVSKERRLALWLSWYGGPVEYAAEIYEGGRRVESLPRGMVVRAGGRALWNPEPFLSDPQRMLDPYALYTHARRICRLVRPDRVGLRLTVERDGAAEPLRVLDVEDACLLPGYKAFGRNEWIGR